MHCGCESSHWKLSSEKERQLIGPYTRPESAEGQLSGRGRQMGLTARTGACSPRGERPAVAERDHVSLPHRPVTNTEAKKTSCQCLNLVQAQVNNDKNVS